MNDVPGYAAGDAMPLDPANHNLRPNAESSHTSISNQEFNTVAWTSSSVK